jgi:hypothetical protein
MRLVSLTLKQLFKLKGFLPDHRLYLSHTKRTMLAILLLSQFKIVRSKEKRCQSKVSQKDLKGQENMTKQRI